MAYARSRTILVAVYAIACLGVLDYAYFAGNASGTQITVGLAMLVLTFPSGCVVGALLGAIAYVLVKYFDATFPMGPTTNMVLVALFGVIGYIQWFVLIPRLWRASR
jgi:hypothetical protein